MKEAKVEWRGETLFEFLHNPKKYIPQTKMNFPGFRTPEDRANVIAYIRAVNGGDLPLPNFFAVLASPTQVCQMR